MKYCPNCGNQANDDAVFCDKCGADVSAAIQHYFTADSKGDYQKRRRPRISRAPKRKKNLNWLLWIYTIFLFLIALMAFTDSFFSGLLLVLAGLLVIPIPTLRNSITRVIKVKNPQRLTAIIALVLLFVAVSIADSVDNDIVEESATEISESFDEIQDTPGNIKPENDENSISNVSEGDVPESIVEEVENTEAPEENEDVVVDVSPAPITEDSYFEIDFIDVGQADSILVMCDGHYMLVDGGNKADSSLIYSYLESREIDYLDYIVGTHGDEDHIGGLAGALNYATAGTVYCSETERDTEAFQDFVKYVEKQGNSIQVPVAGDSFTLGSAVVQVLAPIGDSDDANDISIVLRIVYGETSFVLAGDASHDEEDTILDAGYTLKSDVLKVGHHGSSTSTSYQWLYEIDPEYAVISVGADNTYGHPTEDVLSRLSDADVTVYRTDMNGTVVCTSDGKTISFELEKDNIESSETPEPTIEPTENSSDTTNSETVYVSNSGKIHSKSNCSGMKNYTTMTYDEAIAAGYEPCKKCY